MMFKHTKTGAIYRYEEIYMGHYLFYCFSDKQYHSFSKEQVMYWFENIATAA
jgi:hypothetical protein